MKYSYPRSYGTGGCIFGYPVQSVLDFKVTSMPASPLATSTQHINNNSQLYRAPFMQREHRQQNKGCSRQHRNPQYPGTSPEITQVAMYQRETKDGIRFTNALLHTDRVMQQHYLRKYRIQTLMDFQEDVQNILIDALPLGLIHLALAAATPENFVKFYPHVLDEFQDDELAAPRKHLMDILFVLKKSLRSCSDMVASYGIFFSNNHKILLLGAWPDISDIPDNIHILPKSVRLHGYQMKMVTMYKRHARHDCAAKQNFDCVDFMDSTFTDVAETLNEIHEKEQLVYAGKKNTKHQSRKHRKEKTSRYRKIARRNKQDERNLWYSYWNDPDADINTEDDKGHRTFADVYEEKLDALLMDPSITEAAWAIHDGTEVENTDILNKAYQIRDIYLSGLDA